MAATPDSLRTTHRPARRKNIQNEKKRIVTHRHQFNREGCSAGHLSPIADNKNYSHFIHSWYQSA